jgi:hypothetical protein
MCSVIISHFTGGEFDTLFQEKKIEREHHKERAKRPTLSRVDSFRLNRQVDLEDDEEGVEEEGKSPPIAKGSKESKA